MLDVAPDLDVAEEAEAGALRDALERLRGGLQLRMIGRHAEAHEAPRSRKPLEHVHLSRRVSAEQRPGGVEARRPGADDRDAQCVHRGDAKRGLPPRRGARARGGP